jgi:glycolate oxidase FAD binding subunit
MPTLIPTTTAELSEAIATAASDGVKLELRGGGSKAAIGRPDRAATVVEMGRFAGIVDYDPAELVLTVRPGTPLAEIETLVASERQMLAFEPFDHGPLFGQPAGAATIGGVIAAGVAGTRRLVSGGVRDHLLGFTAVSGRGQTFVAGAKVVKNVTGYDLPKIAAGSWGRLVALTEVTLKVLPAPRESTTRWIVGLDPAQAYAAMAMAMGSHADVSGAVHVPREFGCDGSVTAFRVQGFGPSVAARSAMLERTLAPLGQVEEPTPDLADRLWQDMRTLAPLVSADALWRISIPARNWPAVLALIGPPQDHWLADWAGGLLWLAFAGDPAVVRAAAASAGGHATLVRGDLSLRGSTPTFQPRAGGLAALEERVRRAFDPAGVFETGRFGEDARAD